MGWRAELEGLEIRAGLTCTACGATVDACSICHAGFVVSHVICCRRKDGHDHASCVAARRALTSGYFDRE